MKNEQRKEARKIIDSIHLPFLGTKEEDHLCFEYLLVDLSESGLRIAIPERVVKREQIKKNDIINFHLPYEIDKIFFDQGKVVWTRRDDSMEAQLCGISIENIKPVPYPYPVPSSQKENTLIGLIKDSMLLKKRIYTYLGHVIPYFKRVADHPLQEYPQLKTNFLEDVKEKVRQHQAELENIFLKLQNQTLSAPELSKFIDLEELRSIVRSEIYAEIFKITFLDDRIMPYLNSIKKLEDKLYFNHNIIVMLYIDSL